MHGRPTTEQCMLEAPGDLLSGLLAVCGAETLTLPTGGLRTREPSWGVWRLVFPLEGTLRLTAGELAWTLTGGQAVAVEGGEELSLLAAEDCRLGLITLRGSAAEAVFADCRHGGGLFFARGGLAAERLLRQLAARPGRPCSAKEASEYAYALLMALSGTGGEQSEGGSRLPPVVEAALGLIRRDYAFLDGIAELARRLEVSQEYLTRVFLKYTGMTPGRYLTRVRIENAKLLLRQGGRSVQFVSDACGFSNANYFARVFREAVGMNPRDYARSQPPRPPVSGSDEEKLYVL